MPLAGAGSLQASVAQRGVQVRHAELVAYAGYLFVFAVVPSTVAVFGSRLVWTIALFYAWLALSR